VQPNGSNPGGNTAQAFLTILFFDERFNFIAAADGGVAQQQVAASVTADGSVLAQSNIAAPKNGYAYVYISNQSNLDVFFDNLKVQVVTGNIIEENHYYAYGLKIAAISSKKLGDTYEGTLKNNYLYNDKELFDDGDLNWYDYGFRNYDPQIGRFTQLDPLTDDYPLYTPYQYAGCEPIANVDVDGLEPSWVLSALKSAGATGVSTKVMTTGAHAGKLAVSYFIDGTAFCLLLKLPTPGIGISLLLTSVGAGTKAVTTASNFIKPPDHSRNVAESLNQGSGSLKGNVPGYVPPPPPPNLTTVGPAKELNSLEKQAAASRRAYYNDLNGLNEDGSKKPLRKLAENKTFQRFEKMTGTMAEIGGLMSAGGIIKKVGVKFFIQGAAKTGGRLGNPATRTQIADIATELKGRGYTITGGGGIRGEEYLAPLGGGRNGGSFLDITATHPNYPTLRINTVDIYKNGLPTNRELNNALRIRQQISPGEHLLLIPKR
jgi:RHS repeat-associated protein